MPYQLQRILGQYTELYGGMRDAAALSSVIVEGSIEQSGKKMRFMTHRKGPNLLRYCLFRDANSVTSGYDGEVGWIRRETNGAVEIERLEGADLDRIKEMARFESPLFRHNEKSDYVFKLLPQRYWKGRSVNVIEVTGSEGMVSHYFLDAQKAHILRLDKFDASGGLRGQTLYRDYREVEGFPFAYEVEQRSADETLSVAKVDSISVNRGVLSFYFKEPSR
ncbi:MAG: hypothetical protein GVY36_08655 [Verrucomicrobia bacterium]|nr:hypothetical protein [Verrucomicrobiota bacterium]